MNSKQLALRKQDSGVRFKSGNWEGILALRPARRTEDFTGGGIWNTFAGANISFHPLFPGAKLNPGTISFKGQWPKQWPNRPTQGRKPIGRGPTERFFNIGNYSGRSLVYNTEQRAVCNGFSGVGGNDN